MGESGWGYLYEKSTGFPQIPQTVWVANIFLRAFSNAALFPPACRSDRRAGALFAMLQLPHSPVLACVPLTLAVIMVQCVLDLCRVMTLRNAVQAAAAIADIHELWFWLAFISALNLHSNSKGQPICSTALERRVVQ